MESPSPAERSAEQFGVKLRKVTSESNMSCNTSGSSSTAVINHRRSLPHGPPTRCESRLAQRRSAAAALSHANSKGDVRQSQVALRQEAAEKQAIERRKATSTSSSSRSWEKKKPLLPIKPAVLRNAVTGSALPKSNSCSSISSTGRSTSVPPTPVSNSSSRTHSKNRTTASRQRRAGSSPPTDSVIVTLAEEEEKRAEVLLSWYEYLVSKCSLLQPVLLNFYQQARISLQKQIGYLMEHYDRYEAEFDKEARNYRNQRLTRRVAHGHRFLAVGLPVPSWCDLCSDVLWGKTNICLQCIADTRSQSFRKPVLQSPPFASTRKPQSSRSAPHKSAGIVEKSLPHRHQHQRSERKVKLQGTEYLSRVLETMNTNSDPQHGASEDESDYANLWDSESGSTDASSFNANQTVLSSILRSKGAETLPDHYSDLSKRHAMISSSTTTLGLMDSTLSGLSSSNSIPVSSSIYNTPFDVNKLRSLQDKVANLDLEMTDFDHFSELKHSQSLLELSKILSNTNSDSAAIASSLYTSSDSTLPLQQAPATTRLQHDRNCKYTCHTACEDLLSKPCSGGQDKKSHSSLQLHSNKHGDMTSAQAMDDTDSGYSGTPPGGSAGFTLTKEEICSRIKTYNERFGDSSNGSAAMTLPTDESGVFQGCVQVHINIDRPINMSLSTRPTSIYDTLKKRQPPSSPHISPDSTTSPELLPKNAVMSLHTTSVNTAYEVVSILLKKFKITDNPRSFALFEQTIEDDREVKLRKIGDQERPLLNFLRWSTECKETKRFVLKENDSAEIMYEAFSIPELNNFLRMLDKEESLFLSEIQQKYQIRRRQMALRLSELEQEGR